MNGNLRLLFLGGAASLVGLAIGFIDSRASWNDTGITVVALVAAGAAFAVMGRRRPWLWTLLVAMWVPVLELGGPAGAASLAAFVFAGVGSIAGSVFARALLSDQAGRVRS